MSKRSALILALILSFGLGARMAYLFHATSQPRYEWDDPDHYELKGRILAQDGEGWRWTFDAVRHSSYDQRFYVLPPAYPVFLSLFALFPGYPFNAQLGQALLSVATIALVFVLGRQIHSDRAGLIAAAVYAAWVPNVIAVWSTMQESLYVPLVFLAFVLLVRAATLRESARSWDYAYAGAAFGLATLTRSMPMYVLPVLALLLIVRDRRRSVVNVAALVGGFLLLTIPYSVSLSQHLGRATFVENHGSIFIVERYGGLEGDEPASLVQTATILIGGFVAAPVTTAFEWWETTKSVLHVNGGRLLQIYLGAASRIGALLTKLVTHLFGDIALVVSVILAPLGLVSSRRAFPATFLFAWIVTNIGLVALSGFGGPRLRAPIEPAFIVLASVVLAGGWRTLRETPKAVYTAAALASVILAVIVLPQLPRSFSARADYGVHWPLDIPPKRSGANGAAGFNLPVVGGAVRFNLRSRNPSGDTHVVVRIDGVDAERIRLRDREHRFELASDRVGLVYVELTATDAQTGEPARLFIIVPKAP